VKFGVRIENDWTTAQQLEYAQKAERLGFDGLWAEGNPFKREPFSMLGVLARETERIELGLAVASVYFVHPLIMASLAATVDELSGGRMRLGVGCSSTHALDPLGLRQKKPVATVREAVELIRALLRGGPQNYEGERYSLKEVGLTGATGRPIPIYAAGEAPRMQTMIAEVADGLIFPVANEEYNRRALENVAAGLASAGRSRADFRVVAYARFWMTDDLRADEELLRPLAARLIYRVSPAARAQAGFDEEVAAGYVADPWSIPEEVMHELIVIGGTERALAGVQELADAGFDEVVLDYPSIRGLSHHEQFERCFTMMRRFGEEVLPRVDRRA
jgi:5,10-methylenetetrahydromethanopterin reductase